MGERASVLAVLDPDGDPRGGFRAHGYRNRRQSLFATEQPGEEVDDLVGQGKTDARVIHLCSVPAAAGHPPTRVYVARLSSVHLDRGLGSRDAERFASGVPPVLHKSKPCANSLGTKFRSRSARSGRSAASRPVTGPGSRLSNEVPTLLTNDALTGLRERCPGAIRGEGTSRKVLGCG